MQGTAPSLPVQTPLQIILLIASALLVGARLAGVNLPLLRTDRTVFFTLALIGIMMCSSGMKVAEYGWLNPFTVAGMAAGALALVLILSQVFHFKLPWVADARSAIIALAGIMGTKVVLALVRFLVG